MIISLLLLYWPTKAIINRKNVAIACTVAMMMMVLMISSAIMWMLHILSLSSHQRQTKWNRKKTGTKERNVSPSVHKSNKNDQFNGRLINNRRLHLHVERWIDKHRQSNNGNPTTHNGWQFLFVIFDDIAVNFCANSQNKKTWTMMCCMSFAVLRSAIQKWKKLNVFILRSTRLWQKRYKWKMEGKWMRVCRCQFGIAKKMTASIRYEYANHHNKLCHKIWLWICIHTLRIIDVRAISSQAKSLLFIA